MFGFYGEVDLGISMEEFVKQIFPPNPSDGVRLHESKKGRRKKVHNVFVPQDLVQYILTKWPQFANAKKPKDVAETAGTNTFRPILLVHSFNLDLIGYHSEKIGSTRIYC